MADGKEDAVNKWWHWVRPYWHVLSFFIIITFIAATKWSTVQAYGDVLATHEKRISALEVWQASEAGSMSRVEQEVHDIHEQVVPRK